MDHPIFFDAGVLLGAHEPGSPLRLQMARRTMKDALDRGLFVTSVQALYEFYRVATAGGLLDEMSAAAVLRSLADARVVPIDRDTLARSLRLQKRHGLAIGDALIAQSSLDAGCRLLYSDSLPQGLCFEAPGGGRPELTVVDPMGPRPAGSLHEPRAEYRVTSTVADAAATASAARRASGREREPHRAAG